MLIEGDWGSLEWFDIRYITKLPIHTLESVYNENEVYFAELHRKIMPANNQIINNTFVLIGTIKKFENIADYCN